MNAFPSIILLLNDEDENSRLAGMKIIEKLAEHSK
jgi:hypothetical protein